MATPDELARILEKAEEIQSVGGSLLSNASYLKKWVAALEPCEDEPQQPTQPTGTIWGSEVSRLSGESRKEAYNRAEQTMGEFDIVRLYDAGKGPSRVYNNATELGRWPAVLSFKLDCNEIVAGQHDAEIAEFFAHEEVTYWCLWHECDQADRPFTPDEFIAAWRYVYNLSRQSTNKRLRAVLNLTGYKFTERIGRFWPGDEYVDVLATDPYMHKPSHTAQSISQAGYDFAQAHGVAFAVAECGVETDALSESEMVALIESMSWWEGRCEFVCYFNNPGFKGYRIDNIPAVAAAWRQLTGG